MHAALILKNYYMSDMASQVIICDYLLSVVFGRC
ncbi:unnamed protein product [Paramecium octaurelia]|uniref:Uncharacterized protein n=1 Tax=Paramecium octaurelia TaxID=43137 RepID=A0A8S1WCQ4_PAROT|nr:unnamed protein product [Paramecium octaurelia]